MHNENTADRDSDFNTFLRTILMILENHNFKSTVTTFRKECRQLGYNISNYPFTSSTPNFDPPMKIILENLPDTQPFKIIIENKAEPHANSRGNEKEINGNSPKTEKRTRNTKSTNTNNITKTEKQTKNTNEVLSDMSKNTNVEKEGQNSNVKKPSDVNNLHEANSAKNTNNNNTSLDLPNYTGIGTKIINNKPDSAGYDTLKSKFSNLQTEHQKLIDLVTDLTYALQTSIKGKTEQTRIILNNCETKYPELFCAKPKNDAEVQEADEKFLKESTTIKETTTAEEVTEHSQFINNDLKLPLIEVNTPYMAYFVLNYKKIKTDLQYAETDTKLMLLQALRLRLTRTSDLFRQQSLQEYKYYDVLNIHNCQPASRRVRDRNSVVFLGFHSSSKPSQQLQQSLSRFINALASLNLGRDYITENSLILDALLPMVLDTGSKLTNLDEVTRNMILATLQKISLRYSQRIVMIEEGLTEHLVKFLNSNYNTINEYCLEYSVALLRNLWLHSKARERCRILSKEVLALLVNLIKEQYIFCLAYVRGALHYILSDQYFYKVAKETRIEETLQELLKNAAGKIKEEIKSIIDIYANAENWQQACECGLRKDSDDTINVLEPEIDENEPDQQTSAEYFLENYRLTCSHNDTEFDCGFIRNFYSKPVTPNHNINAFITSTCPDKVNAMPEIQCLEYAAQFLSDRMNEKVLSIANQVEYTEIRVQEHNENDAETANSETIARSFCEETQQYYYTPSKNGIFETEASKNLYMLPTRLTKTIGAYDLKNMSKSLPISPRNQTTDSLPSSAKSSRQYLSPTSFCYRETFKSRSYSDGNTPHIGFCDEHSRDSNVQINNKYTCSCFTEIQRSFEEEARKMSQNKSSDKSNFTIKTAHKHVETNKVCKYKYYPTSNSAPPHSSPKKEKGTGSKSLDENDYSSVFESRPKILRTP